MRDFLIEGGVIRHRRRKQSERVIRIALGRPPDLRDVNWVSLNPSPSRATTGLCKRRDVWLAAPYLGSVAMLSKILCQI
ncbi:unnamed protein product [Linum trigynum]|uniref:Uncharacterized protein n=1 Tax=Linum trigynum TaxID=586398 RepID=A0AAV2E7J8_9ROSI